MAERKKRTKKENEEETSYQQEYTQDHYGKPASEERDTQYNQYVDIPPGDYYHDNQPQDTYGYRRPGYGMAPRQYRYDYNRYPAYPEYPPAASPYPRKGGMASTPKQDFKIEEETEIHSGTESESDESGSKPKKTGRKKIKMVYIEEKNRRSVTFSKRKKGIMKKAYELNVLTGTQVLLLVASDSGHVFTFATNKLKPIISKHENLIQQCLNMPSSPEARHYKFDNDDVRQPSSFDEKEEHYGKPYYNQNYSNYYRGFDEEKRP